MSDHIKVNLSSIFTVSFYENVAPIFTETLNNATMNMSQTLVIRLPDIYDPDSSQAYVTQVMVMPIPSKNFVTFFYSRSKTGSSIKFAPTLAN